MSAYKDLYGTELVNEQQHRFNTSFRFFYMHFMK